MWSQVQSVPLGQDLRMDIPLRPRANPGSHLLLPREKTPLCRVSACCSLLSSSAAAAARNSASLARCVSAASLQKAVLAERVRESSPPVVGLAGGAAPALLLPPPAGRALLPLLHPHLQRRAVLRVPGQQGDHRPLHLQHSQLNSCLPCATFHPATTY